MLKPTKIIKRHHNPAAAAINQPDMKTNFMDLLLEYCNNIVSKCFDLRNILTIFFKDDFTPFSPKPCVFVDVLAEINVFLFG